MLLARPLSYSVLTALFVLIAFAVVLFLGLGTYTRKISVQGVLVPSHGVIKITAAQLGRITEVHVVEGQAVDAGDILFVLSNSHQTAEQGDAEQTISRLLQGRQDSLRHDQAQLHSQYMQRIDAARHRAQDMAAQVRRVDDELALQERHVAMAKTDLDRYSDLADKQFVSPAQVQGRQVTLLDQQQRLAELKRTRAASARDFEAAQADLSDLKVQAVRDEEAAVRALSSTSQELVQNEARRELIVRSPAAGVVTGVAADSGQSVAESQPLASLIPAGSELEAELYAPSRSIGFLKPGMSVQLRYEAYSFQKFGQATGRVREISRAAIRPGEFGAVTRDSSNEPVYRIRVTLDRQSVSTYGVERRLRPGAALDGNIAVDKRRIYEWVLEPFYTMHEDL